MFNITVTSVTVLLFLLNCACNAKPSVVIVGAGPAGIAAASKLLQNNITNIKILEAENRIGGRIYSVKFGDAFVDLGAQWCHGEKNNTVYEMVKNLDLVRPGEIPSNYYHSSREDLDRALVNELYNIFENAYVKGKQSSNKSLGDYIVQRYYEDVAEIHGHDSEVMELADECLDAFSKYALGVEGALSWFDVLAKYDYEECEGNELLDWKGHGYKTVLDVLMQKYPNPEKQLPIDDKIFLNKEVTRVEWDHKGSKYFEKALITCKDKSAYYADYVIFTPSLGVLKYNHKSLFRPPLPEEKENVIGTVGFDAVFKIFLHFPTRWWQGVDPPHFAFIWSEEDKMLLAEEFPEGPTKNGISWLNNLMDLSAVTEENPNLLAAWFVGEMVPDIEKCSNDLLIDGIMYVLSRFFKDGVLNITRPDAIMRHNWYSNPHFRGTYSYQTIKSRQYKESPEIILSKPLTSSNGKQTLLFAGEATHPIYYSTVHGAIETGFREAQRIIDTYK